MLILQKSLLDQFVTEFKADATHSSRDEPFSELTLRVSAAVLRTFNARAMSQPIESQPSVTQSTVAQPDPPLINRRRYLAAFKKITPYTGSTYYPCSDHAIEALTTGNFKGIHSSIFGGFLTKEKATRQLERNLLLGAPLSDSATKALQNLRSMLTWENSEWEPDLIVRTCYDWDKVFFNGRLKGHVTINWTTEEVLRRSNRAGGERACIGHCLSRDNSWRWGHCQIEMNADVLLLRPEEVRDHSIKAGEAPVSPFKYMWGILLHEFCHAYLQILTGHNQNDEDDEAAGFDYFHGKHWQRCTYAVDRRARELLGIGVSRNHPGAYGLAINHYDVENHVVKPKTSRWTQFKKQGYRRVVEVCQQRVRTVVVGKTKLIKDR